MVNKDISFKSSWLSQFGLYKYDHDAKRQSAQVPSSLICVLFGLFCVASMMLFLFINSSITYTDDPPQTQIIIFESTNSTVDPQQSRHTTLAYINHHLERIAEIEDKLPITTPMSDENTSAEVQLRSEDTAIDPRQINKRFLRFRNHRMHSNLPANHRRSYDEHPRLPRPFNHLLTGKLPSAFHVSPNISFPDIPKDYSGQVDSIQEILDQVTDHLPAQRPETFPAYIARTGRKVRFGGTYRHRKNDEMIGLKDETPKQYQSVVDYPAIPLTPALPAMADPFYSFKPLSMADINLLASHDFRFAPKHNIESHQNSNKGKRANPASDIYQQLIRVNNLRAEAERDHSRNSRAKSQQPFSLMLDVYPMHDEDPLPAGPSTTTRRPSIRQVLRKPNRWPKLEQQHLEPQHFSNSKLRPYRLQSNANDAEVYFNRESSSSINKFQHPLVHATENRPSQITVHLNLFPNKKIHGLRDKLDLEFGERLYATNAIHKLRDRILYQVTSTSVPNFETAATNTSDPSSNQDLHPENSVLREESMIPPTSKVPNTISNESNTHPPHQTPIPTHPPTPAQTMTTIEPPSINIPIYKPHNIVPTESLANMAEITHPRVMLTFKENFNAPVATIIPIEPRQQTESEFPVVSGTVSPDLSDGHVQNN